MIKDDLTTLNRIAQIIFDKKGMNILGLDVRGISSLSDFIMIAEGAVDRHVIAIAKEILELLKKENIKALYSEGLSTGDWVVLDFGSIMVHLFMPGLRDKYRLEELWSKGKIVPLTIDIKQPQESQNEYF